MDVLIEVCMQYNKPFMVKTNKILNLFSAFIRINKLDSKWMNTLLSQLITRIARPSSNWDWIKKLRDDHESMMETLKIGSVIGTIIISLTPTIPEWTY